MLSHALSFLKSLYFRKDILFFIVCQYIEEKDSEQYFEELCLLKVVEIYDGSTYRVYSNEILKMMSEAYEKREIAYKDTIKNDIRTIGDPSSVTASIYQARFDEANKLRHKGNRLEVEEAYRSILRIKDTPYEIRKRALINLVSYVSIEHLFHQSAIKAFEDFYISCLYMEMSVGEVLSNLKAIKIGDDGKYSFGIK